jgi:putative oxidoreductase
MKIAVVIVRVLLGALLVFSAIVALFNLVPTPPLTGPIKIFMEGILASGYLFKLIKVTELVCGLALIVGRFTPLATVILFPISVNILFIHASLAPEGLPVALFVILANLFLAYAYRKNYETLVMSKPIQ